MEHFSADLGPRPKDDLKKSMQKLNTDDLPDEVLELIGQLDSKVVGQTRAVITLARAIMRFRAGLNPPGRPILTALFLGPTGTGKTELVRALAEALVGSADKILRIDCAEYQHSHEILKLLGAPPSYVGHKDTPGRFSNWTLRQNRIRADGTEYGTDVGVSIVLFDEIEKAHPALYDLLLGVFDTGKATLGNNEVVDFSKAIVICTSNLGSKDMVRETELGFYQPDRKEIDEKVYSIGKEAARHHFSPEFRNRLDSIVVFHSLGRGELLRILALQIAEVTRRLQDAKVFVFLEITDRAKDWLLQEGTSPIYGARELKRVVQRQIIDKFAALIAKKALKDGDRVTVDIEDTGGLQFLRLPGPRPLLPVKLSPEQHGEQEKAA